MSASTSTSSTTLRAEHAFWVFGFPFLVLHYRIRLKGAWSGPPDLTTER